MVITLDKFGRIIIPKRFREHLGINFGTSLNISEDGKRIVIELVQKQEPVVDKDGILIFTGKLDNKKSDFIKNDRNQRMHKLLTNENSIKIGTV
ncbi:MAG: AbrB/MazE/SpoVT family DNA-binding domain-containing protein [Bacteroidetes bacterium]|nr:AbrB/MazE/SpoVT family DNA-binding domain-containing protein [Bacteroidota bacterium]